MPATGNQVLPIIQVGVIAMHQLGQSTQAIADAAGIARTTVVAIINNPDIVTKYTNNDLTNRLKRHLPDKIFNKLNAVLDNIDPDCKDMTEQQKATVFGILFDKHRIATNQATTIIDYAEVSENIIDVDAKIVELEKKLQIEGAKPPKQIRKAKA